MRMMWTILAALAFASGVAWGVDPDAGTDEQAMMAGAKDGPIAVSSDSTTTTTAPVETTSTTSTTSTLPPPVQLGAAAKAAVDLLQCQGQLVDSRATIAVLRDALAQHVDLDVYDYDPARSQFRARPK